MRNASYTLMLLTLALGLCRCADEPPAFDAGIQSTDTGNAECNPTVQQNWGETCEPYDNSCPANTSCQTIKELGSAQGICSTECCGPGDNDHCPNVAQGLEKCVIEDTHYGKWYCAVICYDNSECTAGQTCQLANSMDRICYPPQTGG
ncbi:MAG TPA: hypothetical protein VM285_14850 [Polyangia bacterium]|nr:hypothetical protein [Polyangia bacterium]